MILEEWSNNADGMETLTENSLEWKEKGLHSKLYGVSLHQWTPSGVKSSDPCCIFLKQNLQV